ncbi:MAG: hypothetical protein CMB29_05615 [Euryarchaeota archaeon]|nr:hypothetical protein [Euryarchaeota archaeon]|tara:strand:+ start:2590 stop:2790 length:201 start_codon:yes stop_codon:yes gene_type:complete
MIQVEGHKHLYRDENTGAIVNCDTTGYMRYKKMRNKKLNEKSEIDSLKAEIDTLKGLLNELIQKNS